MIQPRGRPARQVEYPESDGEPLGETDFHVRETVEYALLVLDDHFRDQPNVYVAADNFIYFAEGNPKRVVSPDAYVVFGVEKKLRRVYKVWEEGGRTPSFVLEVSSRKTRREDLDRKLAIYRDDLAVPEYVIYDPLTEWIPRKLHAFRLVEGLYEPIRPDPATGRIQCPVLGLDLAVVDDHVRFFEPGAAVPLPTRAERAERAAERADRAAERAERAEVEVARLRAEVDRLRAAADGAR